MLRRIPPAAFKLILCPSCGAPIDFTFVLRECVDCRRKLCEVCARRTKSLEDKSRCKPCFKKRNAVTKSVRRRP